MITLKQDVDVFATIKPKKIYRDFESKCKITVGNDGDTEILPKTLLFADHYRCADFKVYLKGGEIPNGESEVSLIYDGIYKRDTCTEKEISLNGSTSILKINCESSGEDGGTEKPSENPSKKPIVQSKSVTLNNRVDFDFSFVVFTEGYYSPINSPLTEISFWGDVSSITYNDAPYIENTFIHYQDLLDGKVMHKAPDVDYFTDYGIYYSVKDEEGNVSNLSVINIVNNPLGTITWRNSFVSLKRNLGEFTHLFYVGYEGATGQKVAAGDVIYREDGSNYFEISVGETKTLIGSGSLQFKIEGRLDSDQIYEISLILFGAVYLTVDAVIVSPRPTEPIDPTDP